MIEPAPDKRDDGTPPAPDQADLFGALGISDALVRAIKELGFEEPTPIQTQAVPAALAGRDVIGQAQTGTGKTAAFGLPVVERVDPADRRVQAVILCPTRELAVQVAEELFKLARFRRGITVLPIYGGQQIERQITALRKGVQIVIGTPGRVLDHIHRRTLQLDGVRFAVLDEADEMLDMGFRDDITEILDQTPKDRQTLLFSATLSPEILHLAQRYLHDPVEVRTVHRELTVPLTEQVYFEVRESDKIEALSRLLDLSEGEKGLVFCNTKRGVDEVVSQLRTRGYAAEGLHGDMKQNQRDRVMARFRQGAIDLLVATDVAARGIDVTDVTTVYNYDMPQDEEYYVHRIGRTGRAGKTGKAYTFVTGREHWKLRDIQKYTKTKIVQRQLPSLADVEEVRTHLFEDRLRRAIAAGGLEKQVDRLERLMLEGFSSLEIAAALLKLQEGDGGETTSIDGRQRTPGTVRLEIGAGRNQNVRHRDILGAFAGETGIRGELFGLIEVGDNKSSIEVPEEEADRVIQVMSRRKIKGRTVEITR
jgi:ATP-dependent RNA helicase DeaD